MALRLLDDGFQSGWHSHDPPHDVSDVPCGLWEGQPRVPWPHVVAVMLSILMQWRESRIAFFLGSVLSGHILLIAWTTTL